LLNTEYLLHGASIHDVIAGVVEVCTYVLQISIKLLLIVLHYFFNEVGCLFNISLPLLLELSNLLIVAKYLIEGPLSVELDFLKAIVHG
jgi:hypothetical protein